MISARAASRAAIARARCAGPSTCSLKRASTKSAVSSFSGSGCTDHPLRTRRTYSSGASSTRRGRPARARPSSKAAYTATIAARSSPGSDNARRARERGDDLFPLGGLVGVVDLDHPPSGHRRSAEHYEHGASERQRCPRPAGVRHVRGGFRLGLGVGRRERLRLRLVVLAERLERHEERDEHQHRRQHVEQPPLPGPRARGPLARCAETNRMIQSAIRSTTRPSTNTLPHEGTWMPPVSSSTSNGACSAASATRASRPTAATITPAPQTCRGRRRIPATVVAGPFDQGLFAETEGVTPFQV